MIRNFILLGDVIQWLHIVLAFGIWYFVGRFRSIHIFLVTFLVFWIMWITYGGCPLTHIANYYFWRGGIDGYYCSVHAERANEIMDYLFPVTPFSFGRFTPYCSLYEWLSTKIGPQLAFFVFVKWLIALYIGMRVTRLKKAGKITGKLLF